MFHWLILLAFLLLHAPLTFAQEKGIFWQIDVANMQPSYLFGTIHSSDPRVIRLPEVVEKKFKQADSLSLELLMNFKNIVQLSSAMLTFNPDEQLKQLLSKKDFLRVSQALQAYDMPNNMINMVKPWAAMMTLSTPKLEDKNFLDFILYQRGYQDKKALYGLETVDEQMAVFESLSLDDQVELLLSTLKYLDEVPALFEQTHQLYLNRDLSGMLALMQEQIEKSTNPALMQMLYTMLLEKRNTRMLKKMQARLAEGNAFIAVGAAHLAGKQGLVALLKQAGHKVKCLY